MAVAPEEQSLQLCVVPLSVLFWIVAGTSQNAGVAFRSLQLLRIALSSGKLLTTQLLPERYDGGANEYSCPSKTLQFLLSLHAAVEQSLKLVVLYFHLSNAALATLQSRKTSLVADCICEHYRCELVSDAGSC